MTYHVFNTEAEVLSADSTKLRGCNAETGEFVDAFLVLVPLNNISATEEEFKTG